MSLSRTQFDAAELETRRQMADRDFYTDARAAMRFGLERSLRLGRTAFYFRNYRQLAYETGLKSEGRAHAAVEYLCDRKVWIKLVGYWHGINTTFLEWNVPLLKSPTKFADQPELELSDPNLKALIMESFVTSQTVLPVQSVKNWTENPVAGRDAGAQQEKTTGEQGGGGDVSPPSQPLPADYLQKFYKSLEDDRAKEEFPEPPLASVPKSGTPPSPPKSHAVRSVPKSGTPNPADAWALLVSMDTSRALMIPRFAAPWWQLCQVKPEYVVNVLPGVLSRQIVRDGRVSRPLALLALAAQKDGMLPKPKKTEAAQ